MNILVLTPDRVGSTLLQRVLTVHMTGSKRNEVTHPVINVHEITNGLAYYHSNVFNQMVLGEGNRDDESQTLGDIVSQLDKVNHSIIGRLAHYHIVRRDDPKHQQLNLYKYINDNFFIIGCRRNSVFEHALSWGIQSSSKKLNVYNHKDKIEIYADLYKNKISIPPKGFINYLNAYKKYIEWSDTHFNVNQYFVYEEHMPSIDKFVDNLDCFNNVEVAKWHDMFGMSWTDWNKCHRLLSDLGGMTHDIKLLEHSDDVEPLSIRNLVKQLPVSEQKFIAKHGDQYYKSSKSIEKLVDEKILVSGIPIKLQTLVEKRMIVENFNECAILYNEWATDNGFDIIKNSDEIINQAKAELEYWYENIPKNLLLGNKF